MQRGQGTFLSNALRWVEVKEHQPGEGELARLWSTRISPRLVQRACKQAGCPHRASLARLPALGIVGRAGEKQRGLQSREGNSKDGGGGKLRNVPGSGKH